MVVNLGNGVIDSPRWSPPLSVGVCWFNGSTVIGVIASLIAIIFIVVVIVIVFVIVVVIIIVVIFHVFVGGKFIDTKRCRVLRLKPGGKIKRRRGKG